MLKFLVSVVLIAAFSSLCLKYIESSSIFFPTKNIELTPANIRVVFEDISFKTADGFSLHGWFIPYENASCTLLFFHGNGGNISDRLDKILLLRKSKVNIFIIDYRGYGRSKGSPSERGLYLDSEAAYKYLIDQVNVSPQNIVVYGESLGAAIAVELALRRQVGALILEGAFTSGRDMGKIIYPFLPRLLIPNIFNTLGKIGDAKIPKLFIHSRDDEIIPFSLGKRLYDEAKVPKELVCINGGHNCAFLNSEEKYTSSIVEFIRKLKEQQD